MIIVGDYAVPDAELTWRFSRASGPGGQHVNTTDTRVQLTFNLEQSAAFPPAIQHRLLARLGGEVTVVASQYRSQLRNRQAASERLAAMLERSMLPPPPPRVRTKPSRAANQRRLDSKRRRGQVKQLRSRPDE